MRQRRSIAEARASLPTIVRQAEAGNVIELTRRGEPVAVVLSVQDFERFNAEQPRFGDTYRKFLAKFPLGAVGLDADFFRSLREAGSGRKVAL